jgi:hypothetical protein
MKKTSKWVWGAVGLAGIPLLLASGSCDTFLLDAGRFMAPVADIGDKNTDAIILEGTEQIHKEIIARAISLLSMGKSKQIVIVLAKKTPDEKPSVSPWEDSSVLKRELEGMGLDENTCRVISTPSRHPMTLTSAQAAMAVLAGEGVRSALLISPGFHMRRSYLVYQSLGEPLKIRIYPHASFDGHNHGLDKWWTQWHGVHDFVEQSIKLVYYMVRGYIPLKLSY